MSTEALVPARQGELQAVSDGLDRLFRASIAPATYRLYERALTALDEALGSQPVTDQALAEYLAGLHAAGRAPATIAIVPAAVRFRAKLEDQPSPAGPLTARAMAGIRREGRDRGRGQAQGVGFSKADAAAVLAAAQGGLGGLRDAALILTASDGLLRVSEVAALEVGDVTAEEDGSGRLQVRRSKTDQEGRGAVLFLGEETLRLSLIHI